MIPKFRAWDYDEKRMHDVLVIDWLNKSVDLDFGNIGKPFRRVELMQSTGLKDKNGVDIFEHDILKNGRGEIGQVIYLQQEAGFVVSLKKRDYRLGHRNTGEGYRTAGYHTVIGNVCENPELLEVSE